MEGQPTYHGADGRVHLPVATERDVEACATSNTTFDFLSTAIREAKRGFNRGRDKAASWMAPAMIGRRSEREALVQVQKQKGEP